MLINMIAIENNHQDYVKPGLGMLISQNPAVTSLQHYKPSFQFTFINILKMCIQR